MSSGDYLVPGAPFLHLVCETIGVVVALAYYRRLRSEQADPVADDHRMILLIAATFGALLGSRLLGALEDPQRFFGGANWLYYLQSKTIVGGLLGGLWAVEVAKRWLGVRRRTGDVYVLPLLVAMIIGRLGCLAMGTGEPTYGLPTDSWLGLDLGDGVRRHATALYEIIFLAILLLWFRRGRGMPTRGSGRQGGGGGAVPGRRFANFLIAYLTYRLLIGFLQPQIPLSGLGAIQWACVAGLLWYIYDYPRRREIQAAAP